MAVGRVFMAYACKQASAGHIVKRLVEYMFVYSMDIFIKNRINVLMQTVYSSVTWLTRLDSLTPLACTVADTSSL